MNKYQRQVPSTTIDVYDVLKAWGVTCPATQHAIKKLLQPGGRGHKDKLTDLREAMASILRAIEMAEDGAIDFVVEASCDNEEKEMTK